MIQHWQTNQEYHCFLANAKTTFDSSERVRLQSELASPSLTSWVIRLKSDRVLASLVGCPLNSLPPLGSYYDLMDRLWTAPDHSLYKRDKLLSPDWNRKNRINPKANIRRLPKTVPPSPAPSFPGSLMGKISLSILKHGSKSFFMLSLYCLLSNAALFLVIRLPYPATVLLSTLIPPRMDISLPALTILFRLRNILPSQDIIPTPMPLGAGTATSIPFTLAIRYSSFPATTLCCIRISHCSSASPVPNAMIPFPSWFPTMSWKNICLPSL